MEVKCWWGAAYSHTQRLVMCILFKHLPSCKKVDNLAILSCLEIFLLNPILANPSRMLMYRNPISVFSGAPTFLGSERLLLYVCVQLCTTLAFVCSHVYFIVLEFRALILQGFHQVGNSLPALCCFFKHTQRCLNIKERRELSAPNWKMLQWKIFPLPLTAGFLFSLIFSEFTTN